MFTSLSKTDSQSYVFVNRSWKILQTMLTVTYKVWTINKNQIMDYQNHIATYELWVAHLSEQVLCLHNALCSHPIMLCPLYCQWFTKLHVNTLSSTQVILSQQENTVKDMAKGYITLAQRARIYKWRKRLRWIKTGIKIICLVQLSFIASGNTSTSWLQMGRHLVSITNPPTLQTDQNLWWAYCR